MCVRAERKSGFGVRGEGGGGADFLFILLFPPAGLILSDSI